MMDYSVPPPPSPAASTSPHPSCCSGSKALTWASWLALQRSTVQISLQQEVQDDVTQQLEAQEAAVARLPGAAHSCGQGGQEVGRDCLVVGYHLLTELAQRVQALQQVCLHAMDKEEE